MRLISKHLNVSPNTVIRQLIKAGESLRPGYHHLPQHLGIDEFKSVKQVSGSMSFIFIDNVAHEVIDIVENRQLHDLFDYFMSYSYATRQAVKTVTMDMYSPYIRLNKDCFPTVKIIIDRFHIVQHLNRALNQVRIQIMNGLRYIRARNYRKLKKQWNLVLKNASELIYSDFHTHWLYDGMVSEYIMANYLIEEIPTIPHPYQFSIN